MMLSIASAADGLESQPGATNFMELSFEQLLEIKVDSVYGASKFQQKLSQAPSAVTIITDDEIKKFGHRNFAEVLRSVRGLYVSYDRNYSYLGIRGFSRPGDYNSRFLVLVDGHRINDNIFYSVLLGNEFPLDVDVIDRVEVIRGPSSSIYGNNAFLGVINVITKRGRDLNGTVLSGEAGSFDSYKGIFSFGKKFQNDLEWMFSGSFYDRAGRSRLFFPEFNNPTNNFGIAKNADFEQSYRYLTTFSFHDFTLQGAFSYREKGVPTGSFGTTFNDRRAKTVDEPAYVDLKYSRVFNEDFEVTGRVFYDYYHYYGNYPYDLVLNKDYATGNRWGTEWQLTKKIFDRHTLTFGSEFQDNFQQEQGNYDETPRTVYLMDKRETHNWAFYGQGEVAILTNLLFNAGLRYDNYDTFGDTLNPRLGLIYSPVEKTAFKLLYGTAFRAPNVYEFYYAGFGSKANPDLKPEHIRTYELVYEQVLPHHLHFTASGFYYQIDDLINQELDPTDGLLIYENLEEVSTRGVELELESRLPTGLRSRLSYTYQDPEDLRNGETLSNSPRHLAKLNLMLPLYRDKLYSGLELQYASSVKTLTGNSVEDYWIANWTLFTQKFIKDLELSASIYNLFDQRYGNPGSGEHLQDIIQQDGRSFRFKLTYRF